MAEKISEKVPNAVWLKHTRRSLCDSARDLSQTIRVDNGRRITHKVAPDEPNEPNGMIFSLEQRRRLIRADGYLGLAIDELRVVLDEDAYDD